MTMSADIRLQLVTLMRNISEFWYSQINVIENVIDKNYMKIVSRECKQFNFGQKMTEVLTEVKYTKLW